MKNYTTDKLYREVTHTKNTVASFTTDSKCLWKNIVGSFTVFKSFSELVGLLTKLCVSHFFICIL